MKQIELIMGMPITLEIVDTTADEKIIKGIFDYFRYVDETFSTYKNTSEITRINNGLVKKEAYSSDMKEVLSLCEQTKEGTQGYFDISHKGKLDPSGIVKGWAIQNASELLKKKGYRNYYIEAGGDIQVAGKNTAGMTWRVGIRNPFNMNENIKVLLIKNEGVATSGTYIRGQHIYNPKLPDQEITDIVSLTIIGPNIYEADRFATAAFAMGTQGIQFIEYLRGFEGYMIDKNGIATYTSGFNAFVLPI